MESPNNVAEMVLGETAVVSDILDKKLCNIFLEMGFVPDALVRCNFKAPFGGCICVHVSGYDLALRREEASMIAIRSKNASDGTTAKDTAGR